VGGRDTAVRLDQHEVPTRSTADHPCLARPAPQQEKWHRQLLEPAAAGALETASKAQPLAHRQQVARTQRSADDGCRYPQLGHAAGAIEKLTQVPERGQDVVLLLVLAKAPVAGAETGRGNRHPARSSGVAAMTDGWVPIF
jgi:hypothetical protein